MLETYESERGGQPASDMVQQIKATRVGEAEYGRAKAHVSTNPMEEVIDHSCCRLDFVDPKAV
jgi:hypothetical protein